MFWWIVLAVVVVGFALAWWTSGRSRPASHPDEHAEATRNEAVRQAIINRQGQPPYAG